MKASILATEDFYLDYSSTSFLNCVYYKLVYVYYKLVTYSTNYLYACINTSTKHKVFCISEYCLIQHLILYTLNGNNVKQHVVVMHFWPLKVTSHIQKSYPCNNLSVIQKDLVQHIWQQWSVWYATHFSQNCNIAISTSYMRYTCNFALFAYS